MQRHTLPTIVLFLILLPGATPAQIVDFEDLALGTNSYYNGVGQSGDTGFTSGGVYLNNTVDPTYFSWGGWSYANMALPVGNADLSQPDYTYQYNAAAATGSRGSSNYAMGYWDVYTPTVPTITLPAGEHPVSLQVTNSTYTALSMLHYDGYSKVFSGPVGNTPGDWFKLTITGYDGHGDSIGAVDFYLADYRSADPAQHYIIHDWTNVNLTSLSQASSLSFTMSSSDNNAGGILTPTYVALDDLSLTKVAGDVNNDQIVNGQDIAAVASNWLHAGPVADANGDGIVNGQDIALVASNWLATPVAGPGQATANAAAVPEPAGLLLAALSLACLMMSVKLRR